MYLFSAVILWVFIRVFTNLNGNSNSFTICLRGEQHTNWQTTPPEVNSNIHRKRKCDRVTSGFHARLNGTPKDQSVIISGHTLETEMVVTYFSGQKGLYRRVHFGIKTEEEDQDWIFTIYYILHHPNVMQAMFMYGSYALHERAMHAWWRSKV